ncbi:MFS transporter [Tessaracoccus antarcticus]|uniref:MFS transporter n=1 Tax=Tessaracoccus antarcticus TaxID=2479848 RepID=A0A3M0GAA9_9ACTN|nr:MFS transporter [Tessaracoccus antarcticus]RMB61217.1 MFS transporter [Tessaracoccus antarcticus]
MPAVVSPEARRARWGVIALFWLNGVAWASILPRYPEIKQALGLSDTFWGVSVGIGPIGGLVAGLFTARLMRRFNSAVVAVASLVLYIAMLNVIGNAPVAAVFAVGVFLMAAFDALTDISMNAHGLRVQKLYGRSILNSFHGWWSIGAVCGGFLGSAAAQWHVPIWLQCLVATVVFATMALASKALLLRTPDHTELDDVAVEASRTAPRRIPSPILIRLVALGLLGASAGLIEDTGATWGAVYMDRAFVVTPFLAGMAFVALQGAQMVGRFTGDALVNRLGSRPALMQGGAIAALGMAAAVAFPSPAATLIGFACAGWGVATAIPSAMHAADELPGMRTGSGLTIVTWMMRLGFFTGPPLIGLLADATALRWALLVVPACALVMLLLTPALKPLHSKPHGNV